MNGPATSTEVNLWYQRSFTLAEMDHAKPLSIYHLLLRLPGFNLSLFQLAGFNQIYLWIASSSLSFRMIRSQ